MGLSVKQKRFVDAYLGQAHFNATGAARLAGYSVRSASDTGYDLLRNPEIQAAIRGRVTEFAMGAEEVLSRMAEQARSDVADFVNITEGGYQLDLEKASAAGRTHLIAELAMTEHGPKVKLYDAQAALVQLGRHHKLWTDKNLHEGSEENPVRLTITEVVIERPEADAGAD